MDIMYVCDDSFAYIAGISILSLLENNKRADCINIYLVNDGISIDNLDKLRRTVECFKRNLINIDKPNIKELIGCDIETHHWTENIFARLFLSTVLKDYPKVEKLIYIDSDTLVLGDLSELWKLELDGMIAAGVLEAMGNLHKKAIGLKKKDSYFNSGVILFDVKQWRDKGYDKRVVDFIHKTKGKLEYPDECVLNGIASRNMMVISPKYNFTSLSTYFTQEEVLLYRKPSFHYSGEELNIAKVDVRIVHFTSTFLDVRPWVEGCKHPYVEIWKQYKVKSLWNDIPPQKDNRSKKRIILRKIAMILPHNMRLVCTGFVHAYIKPLKYMGIY